MKEDIQLRIQGDADFDCLSGLVDPVVPWPFVLPWFRRHCPGFRGSRVIFNADHNVLGTAPAKSAAQVLKWMQAR